MKLAVIGTGYVGLVSGTCFAELGHTVICVDKLEDKIELLERGEVPIYEPGLQEMLHRNSVAGRLSFTTDLEHAVKGSDIIILAVGTPSLPSGEADLTSIQEAAVDIAAAMNGYKIIVTKSTVPVGTNEHVAAIIADRTVFHFDVASVPEFLREGSAIEDTLHPDRIVIGTSSILVGQRLRYLHLPLTEQILLTDVRSAEMIKYASNAFLATKISFINEIANICEKVGADVTQIAAGMGLDKRIGSSFLKAGIGYGGSCFPKDTEALIQIAGHVDYDFKLLKSVVEVNKEQHFNVIRKLESIIGDLHGTTIAVWGLAFKPETDDVRAAPAIEIIHALLERGAYVKAYDPVASENFQRLLTHPRVEYCASATEAAESVDALCLLTEWKEFADVSLSKLESLMNRPIMIDGRNVFSEEQLASTKFVYYSVGRPGMNQGEQGKMSFY